MISFFRAPVRNPYPESQLNTSQVYNYIINPLYSETMTTELRSIGDCNTRRHYKSTMFDYVTFSGHFAYRSAAQFVGHTGLFCFDFDHLASQEQYDQLRTRMLGDPYLRTVLLFRSPSGDGLKWVVESPVYAPLGLSPNTYIRKKEIVSNHKLIYTHLAEYIELIYGVKPDATSDVSRACYLPFDPDCYHQFPLGMPQPDNYERILAICRDHQPPKPEKPKWSNGQNGQVDIALDDRARIEDIVARIEHCHLDITSDYNNWVKIGFAIANAFGASGSGYFHRISQYHPRYDYDQTERLYASCLRTNNGSVSLGTLVYLMNLF